jgi:hypothetical protein
VIRVGRSHAYTERVGLRSSTLAWLTSLCRSCHLGATDKRSRSMARLASPLVLRHVSILLNVPNPKLTIFLVLPQLSQCCTAAAPATYAERGFQRRCDIFCLRGLRLCIHSNGMSSSLFGVASLPCRVCKPHLQGCAKLVAMRGVAQFFHRGLVLASRVQPSCQTSRTLHSPSS